MKVLDKESIIQELELHGFNPTDKQVDAIHDTFAKTKLEEFRQFEVLGEYCRGALCGIITMAMDHANKQIDETPEKTIICSNVECGSTQLEHKTRHNNIDYYECQVCLTKTLVDNNKES